MEQTKKRSRHSDLPFCCGVGLPLAQHRQGTASRHHFLFDLPRYQVAGFHSQEVDAWLEPHPAETDEKREEELRLNWSSDEHVKKKSRGKNPKCHSGSKGDFSWNGIRLAQNFPAPIFWLIFFNPWSWHTLLCKMSFKIDSHSVGLPPAEYFGGKRQKSDSRSSHHSSHFYQTTCRVTELCADARWAGDDPQITMMVLVIRGGDIGGYDVHSSHLL